MKLSFYALLIMGIFSLAACGDDDDGVQLTSGDLVGTWDLTAYDSDADVSIGFAGITETSKSTSTMTESTVTITFNSDGTWASEGNYTISTTADGMTETSEEEDGIGSGTYTVADGKLTMSNIDAGDESDVNEIEFDTNYSPDTKVELTGNAMESGTEPLTGLEFSIDLDLMMVLEK